MKKLIVLSSLLLSILGRLHAQTPASPVHLYFNLGILSDASGTTPIADGSLIQVLASYNSTTLSAPTSTSFLGTSEEILWQGAFDSSSVGVSGATIIELTDVPLYVDGTIGNYLTAGDALFVRWFPSLTTSASVPGVTSFGQYGYTSLSGQVLDTTWVVPSAGSTTNFFLLTESAGGELPDSLGQATASTSAVPEPSTTVALFGLAALSLGAIVRRRARIAT